jgi:hypothetical protein
MYRNNDGGSNSNSGTERPTRAVGNARSDAGIRFKESHRLHQSKGYRGDGSTRADQNKTGERSEERTVVLSDEKS